MKTFSTLAIVALLCFGFSSVAYGSDFCNGFKRGYVAGYKRASNSGLTPFAPFCPFQPFKGFGDPRSDYEHGYVIGLEKGLAAGQWR